MEEVEEGKSAFSLPQIAELTDAIEKEELAHVAKQTAQAAVHAAIEEVENLSKFSPEDTRELGDAIDMEENLKTIEAHDQAVAEAEKEIKTALKLEEGEAAFSNSEKRQLAEAIENAEDAQLALRFSDSEIAELSKAIEEEGKKPATKKSALAVTRRRSNGRTASAAPEPVAGEAVKEEAEDEYSDNFEEVSDLSETESQFEAAVDAEIMATFDVLTRNNSTVPAEESAKPAKATPVEYKLTEDEKHTVVDLVKPFVPKPAPVPKTPLPSAKPMDSWNLVSTLMKSKNNLMALLAKAKSSKETKDIAERIVQKNYILKRLNNAVKKIKPMQALKQSLGESRVEMLKLLDQKAVCAERLEVAAREGDQELIMALNKLYRELDAEIREISQAAAQGQ